MGERQPGPTQPPAAGTPEDRLDSWKRIAVYLGRDISTVQRWERREGMPVHRHQHHKLGSVYAFRSELHAWWVSRSNELAREPQSAPAPLTQGRSMAARVRELVGAPVRAAGPRIGIAIAALVAAAVVTIVFVTRSGYFWRDPLANARFSPLTDFEGTESAAAISRDGRFVAFLADRDGRVDVWLTEVGRGDFRNLTGGTVPELVNPSIRTLGFSPDAALVALWTRQPEGSKSEDINVLAAPISGGVLQPYLAEAAEFDWSSDGRRLVYHTTAPGDPMFVRDGNDTPARKIHVASGGMHCHFPVWSPDDAFIYFVQGVPPDEWDIWRIAPDGGVPERMTSHNARVTHPVLLDSRTLLYVATDRDGSGPGLYAMDVERRIPHRVSSGIERYTSLAASAGGKRLVATVADRKTSLWRARIGEQVVPGAAATQIAVPTGRARSPRIGPDYVLYVSSQGGSDGIWKLASGAAVELWSAPKARVIGAPSIAPDGRRIAFVTAENKRTTLWVMNADGTEPRVVSKSLELRGNGAWAPEGESIVFAANQQGTPRLFRIPINGESPTPLVSEYSVDPVWSPDGRFLVYAGPDVGTSFPLRAVTRDGRAYPLPGLILTRGARVAFGGGPHAAIVLRGDIEHKNFWLVDLQTGAQRQLTDFTRGFIVQDFDVTADGSEIVFERAQESSDIVLIER